MKTLYIAAEKLVTWDQDGKLAMDEQMLEILASHAARTRFVVCFAPARFGLIFDSQNEVSESWNYMATALQRAGFVAHHAILFAENADIYTMIKDFGENCSPDERPAILSDNPEDLEIANTLGIPCIHEVPADFSGLWHRVGLRRAFKMIVSAALHP